MQNRQQDIHDILLEAHRRGIEQAIDLSIRTGVPLVVQEGGKIKEIKPKYKYVRVPIQPKSGERSSRLKQASQRNKGNMASVKAQAGSLR